MGDKKTENMIKDRLQGFESDAPSDSWDAIEAAIGDAPKVPFYKRPLVFIPVLILLFLGLVTVPFIISNNNSEQSANEVHITDQHQQKPEVTANTEEKEIGDTTIVAEISVDNIDHKENDYKSTDNTQGEVDTQQPIVAEKSTNETSNLKTAGNSPQRKDNDRTLDALSNDIKLIETNEEPGSGRTIQNDQINAEKQAIATNDNNQNQQKKINTGKGQSIQPKNIKGTNDIQTEKAVQSIADTDKSKGGLKGDIKIESNKVETAELEEKVLANSVGTNDEVANVIDSSLGSQASLDGVDYEGVVTSVGITNSQETSSSEHRSRDTELSGGDVGIKKASGDSQISGVNTTLFSDSTVSGVEGGQTRTTTSLSEFGSPLVYQEGVPIKLTPMTFEYQSYSIPDIKLNFYETDSKMEQSKVDEKVEIDRNSEQDNFGAWSAYFYGMPTFSYHRIESNTSDDILITSVEKVSPFSADRLGFRLEAGIQRAIGDKFNISVGALYWHSNQEFKYNIQRVDSIVTEADVTSNAIILSPQFSNDQRTYKYSLRNVGLHFGASFNLSNTRLVQQVGAGLEIHKGLNKPDLGELVVEQPDYYVFYNLFYRMEYPREKQFRLLVQPTFNYSLSLNKNFEAPFYVKPYGFGLNFGFVYRFK